MSLRTCGTGTCPARQVLIVEDNADGRQTLRTLLELLGHQVEVAGDGVEGVRKGLAEQPEVAVIDIGLPGVDGYEVARRLRAGLGDSVLLLAHTAYADPEDRRRARDAGFDAHLVKPLALDDLLDWLATGAHRTAC